MKGQQPARPGPPIPNYSLGYYRGHIVRIPHVHNLHTREPKLIVTSQPIKGLKFNGHNGWLVEAMKTLFLAFIVLSLPWLVCIPG